MSSFLSGLRSALTRATSYGSASSDTSAQPLHEAPVIVDGEAVTPTVTTHESTTESTSSKRSVSPAKRGAFQDEDGYINIDASQLQDFEDVKSTDESHAPSSRTLSFDENEQAGPSTPVNAVDLSTPKTIFQTAQKDLFKSAFKSAAKDRDIFMTAKPTRTWHAITAQDYQDSPLAASDADDSSFTLSHTLEGTPSISSKRDRDEEVTTTSPKRRRTSQSSASDLSDDEKATSSKTNRPSRNHQISQLDTTNLSDSEDETSALSSSSDYSFSSPPPGLDRKARKSWKRHQRRAKSAILQQVYGARKPRVSKRTAARSGFKRSISGREILIGHARRRFWEGKVYKDVYCC